jgi:hypothetical protein
MSVSRAAIVLAFGIVPFLAQAGEGPAGGVPSFARELPAVKTGEPVFAFNGKDLTGFYPYTREHQYNDPNQVFTVHDGMIHVSGREFGGLATCGNFRDYQLIVEWKWGEKAWPPRAEKARDSGILLHCVGPDGAAGGQWMESHECQIIEGGCGDFIMVAGRTKPSLTCETRTDPSTGRELFFEKRGAPVTKTAGRYNWWGRDPRWKDTLGFRGARDVEKPVGEWNRMEVICEGDSITNILNGFVVNVGTKSSLTEGKIQLQSEGAEIFFRKVEIRPLLK